MLAQDSIRLGSPSVVWPRPQDRLYKSHGHVYGGTGSVLPRPPPHPPPDPPERASSGRLRDELHEDRPKPQHRLDGGSPHRARQAAVPSITEKPSGEQSRPARPRELRPASPRRWLGVTCSHCVPGERSGRELWGPGVGVRPLNRCRRTRQQPPRLQALGRPLPEGPPRGGLRLVRRSSASPLRV